MSSRNAGTFRKTPTESQPLGFDFVDDLDVGETISSATFSVVVVDGADPDVGDMLTGSSAISGSEVRQRVRNGVAGVTYEVRAVVVTSASNTKQSCAYLVVEAC